MHFRINQFFAGAFLALAIFFLNVSTGLAADDAVGMVTGSNTGTYIKVGQDIAEMASREGIDILVKESGGSLDNINRMNSRENAAFGIVQSDVLGYLQRSSDQQLKAVAGRLRLVFPLYKEEVHIFASRSINQLSDLNGKRVSVGESGGGSWLTAMNLFKLLGIKPAEILNQEKTQAAASVLDGNLDAMLYVAGKPVSFFEKMKELKDNPKYAEHFSRVHFVPVSDEKVLSEYVSSSIGPDDYAWVDESVPTVAVKAMMISFDFSSGKNEYYDKRCSQLASIGKAIRDNLSFLQSNGRTPKWKEVDPEAGVGSWPLDRCSRKAAFPNKAVNGQSGTMDIEKALRDVLAK